MLQSLRKSHPPGRRAVAVPAVTSRINVTPLVDVCLVLLIIFMLVTPLLDKLDVDLPRTSSPLAMPQTPRQLSISLRQNGDLYLEGSYTAERDLLTALRSALAADPNRPVVVRADHRLAYRRVRDLLRTLNLAGLSHAGLATERTRP